MDFSEFPDDLVQAARERVADKKDKLAEDCLKDDIDHKSGIQSGLHHM